MVESKKETKKLENFKDNQENKEAIAASQGKALESKDESFSVAQKEIKKDRPSCRYAHPCRREKGPPPGAG